MMSDSAAIDELYAALGGWNAAPGKLADLEGIIANAVENGLLTSSAGEDLIRSAAQHGRVPDADLVPLVAPGFDAVDPNVDVDGLPHHRATRLRGESSQTPRSDPRSRQATVASGQLLAGRYLLERELGRGGMGVVFLAHDEEVRGEVFAVKVLTPAVRQMPEALDLMREEVRKTRALTHPNIVGVYSLNVDGDTAYVLMEFLEGKTLDSLLSTEFGRGMKFSRAWSIIEDVCRALAHAHDHNVIHSDLKPANIFVTTSGKAKVLDFGIARAARHRAQLIDPAEFGALTTMYASYEMLTGSSPDQRDDVYSLACVIYEMLSGRHPYGEDSATEAEAQKARVFPLSSLTGRQNRALGKALAFHRRARTESVEALLDGLAAPAGLRGRLTSIGALLAGTATLVAAIAIGWWLWPHTPRASTVSVLADGVQKPVAVAASSQLQTPGIIVGPGQTPPAPAPTGRPVALDMQPEKPCHAALARSLLETTLNSGLDASAASALYAAGSSEGVHAASQLRASVDCLKALRVEGITSKDSERFLNQANLGAGEALPPPNHQGASR